MNKNRISIFSSLRHLFLCLPAIILFTNGSSVETWCFYLIRYESKNRLTHPDSKLFVLNKILLSRFCRVFGGLSTILSTEYCWRKTKLSLRMYIVNNFSVWLQQFVKYVYILHNKRLSSNLRNKFW